MVNMAIIVGNLGQDPELRHTSGGTSVCTLSVATNRKWTDSDGNKKEDTQWHRIIVWAKTAENCKEYLSKGSSVYVRGRLQTREWDDKEGNKRWTTEIVAEDVRFLSKGGGGGGQRTDAPPPPDDDVLPF